MRALYVSAVCLAGLSACFYLRSAYALNVADLTNRDAAQGIKGDNRRGGARDPAKSRGGQQRHRLESIWRAALIRLQSVDHFDLAFSP